MAKATTKTDITLSTKAHGIVGVLDALCEDRHDFEANEFARSNKRLYAILSQIHAAYEVATANKALFNETTSQLKSHLQSLGFRIQENTKDIALFVRAVFRTERQRVYNYVLVIEAAISHRVSSEGLADFIEQQGGIEDCKKLVTAKANSGSDTKKVEIEQYEALVLEQLEATKAKPLASFKVPLETAGKIHENNFVFAIGSADSKGTVKILSVVPAHSNTVETWALKQLALYLYANKEVMEQKEKATRKATAIQEAIASAVVAQTGDSESIESDQNSAIEMA